MLSSSRLSQLPSGVRELVLKTSRIQLSHALPLCRTGAFMNGKISGQRRGITINQLEDGKDSTFLPFPNTTTTDPLPRLYYLIKDLTTPRPRTRSNPRLRLGGLHSRPLSRLLKVPSRRSLPPLLLRLHAPPRLNRSRHPGVPDRARTCSKPEDEG
jgi:hypothetical protein